MSGRPLTPHREPRPSAAAVTPADLVSAAFAYAAAGIPVLPLHTPTPRGGCSCRTGSACPSPGKHPRLLHGLHDATVDATVIEGWWRRWPDANIGLATGTMLDVCDVDTRSGLRAVLDVLGVIRPTGPLVRTGHGWHLWYAASDLPSRVAILPGVDWRGRGGLVVAPPSLHTTGSRYTFQQPWRNGAALPACPGVLRALVLPVQEPPRPSPSPITDLDRYLRAAVAGEVERILRAPRPLLHDGRRIRGGGRNDALNRAAFRLGQLAARMPIDEASVRRQLTDAALASGLGRAEVQRTITSGWRAGLRHPRRVDKRRDVSPHRGRSTRAPS